MNHYQHGEIECIDALRSAASTEGFRGFCQLNILKYVWRYQHKGGVQDLKKAQQYLEWLIDDIA